MQGEENFLIIPYVLAACFMTILWPCFSAQKSKVHRIGMLLHLLALVSIFAFIAYGYYEMKLDHDVSISIINNFNVGFKISGLGLIFCGLILLLWPAAYLYSVGYLSSTNEGNDERFLIFLNLSFVFTIALSFAGNLLTMFIFYESLSLATIPLVGHNYSTHVNKALKKYIFFLFSSSLCLFFPAIVVLNNLGIGSFSEEFREVIIPYDLGWRALLFGLCIYGIAKAAIFPIHSWLPSAMAANYPTSSILHGVLVVNTGIYCILKIVFEIYGQANIAGIIDYYQWIMYIPLVGVFYSGVMGIFQVSVKKILAWSTVSQLNLMFLFIISGISNAKQVAMHSLLLHSFSKLTLFFSCGIIYSVTRATRLEDFRHVYKKFPSIFTIFASSSLLITGLSMGFIGKFKDMMLFMFSTLKNEVLVIAILLSTLTSLIYYGKTIIYMGSSDGKTEDIHGRSNIYMKIATIYVFIISFIFNLYTVNIFNFLIKFLP